MSEIGVRTASSLIGLDLGVTIAPVFPLPLHPLSMLCISRRRRPKPSLRSAVCMRKAPILLSIPSTSMQSISFSPGAIASMGLPWALGL